MGNNFDNLDGQKDDVDKAIKDKCINVGGQEAYDNFTVKKFICILYTILCHTITFSERKRGGDGVLQQRNQHRGAAEGTERIQEDRLDGRRLREVLQEETATDPVLDQLLHRRGEVPVGP